MSTRYRDMDGDTWESRTNNRVSLIQVAHLEDADMIGDPIFTNVPFTRANAAHHLTQITGGAR